MTFRVQQVHAMDGGYTQVNLQGVAVKDQPNTVPLSNAVLYMKAEDAHKLRVGESYTMGLEPQAK